MPLHPPNDILFRIKDGVGIAEINRPAKKNALNSRCWELLESILDTAGKDPEIRVLVVTGTGTGMFCSGVDVSLDDPFMAGMLQALETDDPAAVRALLKTIHDILLRLASLPIPTIAAFNGDCFSGGLELALACDIRVARATMTMAFQETRLGLMPDLGGTVRLSRLVGPGTAKDLIFSCRKLTSDQAMRLGLVQHVFPDAGFMDQVIAYAGTLAANSPRAIEGVKATIDASAGLDLESAMALERRHAASTILSRQCVEGIGAFLEKRPPVWKRTS